MAVEECAADTELLKRRLHSPTFIDTLVNWCFKKMRAQKFLFSCRVIFLRQRARARRLMTDQTTRPMTCERFLTLAHARAHMTIVIAVAISGR